MQILKIMRKIPKDNAELKEYFQEKFVEFTRDCDEGIATACFSLGEWYQLVKKDVLKASTIYEDACFNQNNGNSCGNLARLYYPNHKDKEEMKKISKQSELQALENDNARTRFLFKKACDTKENIQACTSYATLQLYQKNLDKFHFKEAVDLLDYQCQEEIDAKACFQLGTVFLKPNNRTKEFQKQDSKAAFKLMKRSCDYGFANACQVLAVMFKKGDGVPQSDELFEKYKEKTIEFQSQSAEQIGVTTF